MARDVADDKITSRLVDEHIVQFHQHCLPTTAGMQDEACSDGEAAMRRVLSLGDQEPGFGAHLGEL